MRIKHWQGYGCVNAKKVSQDNYCVTVRVTGNHEWGLITNDKYHIENWLGRFLPKGTRLDRYMVMGGTTSNLDGSANEEYATYYMYYKEA